MPTSKRWRRLARWIRTLSCLHQGGNRNTFAVVTSNSDRPASIRKEVDGDHRVKPVASRSGNRDHAAMSEIPDRALTFRVHFSMRNGVIRSQGIDVGHITGTVIIPLRATFRTFPPPGSYNVELPGSGLPELIVETMGSVDAAALLATLNPPPPAHWNVIPEECLERLELEAQLDFQSVQADEEWKANEPADIETAGTHFDGTWKLTIPFPLGFGFARDDTQLNMDRRDYELDGRVSSVRKDVTGAGTKVG